MADKEITSALRLITAYPDVLSLQDKQRLFKSLLLDKNIFDIFTDLSPLLVEDLLVAANCYLNVIQNITYVVGDELIEAKRSSKDKRNRRKGKLIAIKEFASIHSLPLVPHRIKYYIACIGDWGCASATNHDWARFSNNDHASGFIPDSLLPVVVSSNEPEEIKSSPYTKILSAWEDTFRYNWYKIQCDTGLKT